MIEILETPATATDRIFFRGNEVYDKAPTEFRIEWNRFNLTTNLNAGITISLYGYRETTIRYEKFYIEFCVHTIQFQTFI